ncbi:MAG: flagellar assembly protein FliW [Thermotoga sp. 4484_232]|nr:flagellar assembly protein FliW [Thermotogaceae bacterium]OQX59038.1 MAG: flagellar assembly protein FliW [Thermotoga sp. 4484_232]HDG62085.1 flagellar assembly protein FliW [Thermotoga sp.]
MIFKTKLGEMDLSEKEIITFEEGIPGFDHLRKFAIVSVARTEPIKWLVSLEDKDVALPIIDPWIVRLDYHVDIPEKDVQDLGIEKNEDVSVWCVVVIPKDKPDDATINLLAPIVVNMKNGKAKQIIMETDEYTIKHRIKDELERSKKISYRGVEGAII